MSYTRRMVTEANQWMECDGLKDEICGFCEEQPNFPPNQIHLVLWENVGNLAVNLPVNITAQRLMAGCPTISPLPHHLTQSSGCIGDAVIISSPENEHPRTTVNNILDQEACHNTATPTHMTDTKTVPSPCDPLIIPAMGSTVADPTKCHKVRHLGLPVLPGIKPIGNSVAAPSNIQSHSLGTLPADRGVKKLNEISSFIANSIKVPVNMAVVQSCKGENVHSDSSSQKTVVGNSQKNANMDRLQRLRDKLSKIELLKANAMDKGNINSVNHCSNVNVLNTNNVNDKRRKQQVKAVSHLSTSTVNFKSPKSNQHLVNKSPLYSSVMRSPSQQKSSIQELLAKVRGAAPTLKGSQTFDGYKPKKGFTSLKIDVKTGVAIKSPISPNKKNTGKRKKISFGAFVSKGNDGRKAVTDKVKRKVCLLNGKTDPTLSDNSKMPKKAKFLITESETVWNSRNTPVKHQPAISPKHVNYHYPLDVQQSEGKRNGKSASQESFSNFKNDISDNNLVKYCVANKQDNLISEDCNSSVPKEIYNSSVGNDTTTLYPFDQAVPMPEAKSHNADNNFDTNNIYTNFSAKTVDSQSHNDNSNPEFPDYNCKALDDVMSELCATLDIPDPPISLPENGDLNSGSCSNSSPIKKLLEENLPPDLDQSIDFDATGFDTLLFNDSM